MLCMYSTILNTVGQHTLNWPHSSKTRHRMQGPPRQDTECKVLQDKTQNARSSKTRHRMQGPPRQDTECKVLQDKTQNARSSKTRHRMQGPQRQDTECKVLQDKTQNARSSKTRHRMQDKVLRQYPVQTQNTVYTDCAHTCS